MNIKHIFYSAFVLAAVSTLAACGGGSDSSTPTTPTTPTIPTTPTTPETDAVFGDAPVEYSMFSLSTIDSMLQLAYLADNIVDVNKASVLERELSCSNGGLMEYIFSSPDTAGYSAGEQVIINYRECELSELNSVVSGSVAIVVDGLDIDGNVSNLSMTLSDLEVLSYGTVTMSGQFQLSLSNERFNQQWVLTVDEDLDILLDGEQTLTLHSATITRIADFSTAKYSIDTKLAVTEHIYGGSFNATTSQALSGYFGEFPNEGEVTMSSSASSNDLLVTANFVENSNSFEFYLGSDEVSGLVLWDDAVEGAYWSYDAKNMVRGNSFRSDNFQFLGSRVSSPDNFPLLGQIDLIFSRPISTVASDYIYFDPSDWSVGRTDAVATINGASLTLTPASPLAPGLTYSTNYGVGVFSQQDQYARAGSVEVTSSSDATASISASNLFYTLTDSPSLTVEATFADGSTAQEYRWSDTLGLGITFDSQEGGTATLDLSAVEGEVPSLDVMVEVESSTGLLAYAMQTLTIIPNDQTMLAFFSESGDYIGGGQSVVFTLDDGNFNVQGTAPFNYLDVRFNGYDWWGLDLAAEQNDPLQVGKYTGATRWPFQSPTAPGLSFTGSGRGCNQSFGEFEIFELEFDNGSVSRLAVAWTQHCESLEAPALYGVFRFNSDYQFSQ